MMNKAQSIFLVALLLAGSSDAAGKYWWQNDKSAFGSPSGSAGNAAINQHTSSGGCSGGYGCGGQQPAPQPQPPISNGCGGGGYGGGGGCGSSSGGNGGLHNTNPTPAFPAPAANNFQNVRAPASNSNNNFQNVPANNNNQGQSFPNRQPQQQPQPQVITTGSCPRVENLPPVEFCSGKQSNCWSVGQQDTDCLNNALCCFDGCGNTCYYGNNNNNGAAAAAPSQGGSLAFNGRRWKR